MNTQTEFKRTVIPGVSSAIQVSIDQKYFIDEKQNNHVVIVLDRSTSTCNLIDFKDIKIGLMYLVHKMKNKCKVTLVVHSGDKYTNCEGDNSQNDQLPIDKYDITSYTNEESARLVNILLKTKSHGNTNILCVYNELCKIVDNFENNQNLSFIFLTDFIDTVGNDNDVIKESMTKFIEKLETKTTDYQFHVLCPNMIYNDEIASKLLGHSQNCGTFSCLDNVLKLHNKLKQLISTICPISNNVVFIDDVNNIRETLDQSRLSCYINNIATGAYYLPLNISENSKICIVNSSNEEIKSFDITTQEIVFSKELYSCFRWFEENYIKYTNIITNNQFNDDSKKELNDFLDVTKKILDNYTEKILKLQFTPETKGCPYTYGKIYSGYNTLLKQKDNLLNNLELSLNGIKIKDKNIMKKNKLENYINKIEGIEMSEDDLKTFENCEQLKSIDDKYLLKDCKRLLKNRDCLCIGLSINKHPNKSLIDEINFESIEIVPVYVSMQMFLNLNHSIDDDTMSEMFKMNDKKMNIVMPLFLCEKHWEISKQWYKRLHKLNIIDINNKEVFALPFLALGKAIMTHAEKKCEDSLAIANLLLSTCCQIMKDLSENTNFCDMFGDIYNKYNEYLKGAKRLPSFISNNLLFVIFLYVTQKIGPIGNITMVKIDKEKGIKMIQVLAEEGCRRSQYTHSGRECDEILFSKIFGIKEKDWVDNTILNISQSKSKSQYKELIEKLANREPGENDDYEENSEMQNIGENCDKKWTGELPVITKLAELIIKKSTDDYNKYVKPTIELFKFCLKRETRDIIGNASIESIGLDTTEKKLTFALQNYAYATTGKIHAALHSGTHFDPFEQNECVEFIKMLGKETIEKINENHLQLYRRKKISNDVDTRANIFGETDDLDEAAGALLGVCIGRNITDFVRQLQHKSCPLAIEKIKLLMSGNYKNIKLFADSKIDGWNPSRKQCIKLWRQNMDLLVEEKWIELFPEHENAINAWYQKIKGIHVYNSQTTYHNHNHRSGGYNHDDRQNTYNNHHTNRHNNDDDDYNYNQNNNNVDYYNRSQQSYYAHEASRGNSYNDYYP